MMKVLVLGLGNPILTDDGVGPHVAKEKRDKLRENVTIMEASLAGLNVLDLLVGYDRAIIIDSIKTRGGKAGQIYRLDLGEFEVTRHAVSTHGVNLVTALGPGKMLGLDLPHKIDILAIEVAETASFRE